MITLGINTGFAVNRYAEPEVWADIIGTKLGLRYAQLTADLINVSLPDAIIEKQAERIAGACAKHNVQITSTFTGAFTRVNHLAHPDPDVRAYWVEWFKRFVDVSVRVGASSMGSHFGIFTMQDDRDPGRRAERRAQNIEGWHEIGRYAKAKGLSFLSWEPMSITREQGETLAATRALQDDVNRGAPIPFRICLDVDHGDLASKNPDDTDPYAWLAAFAKDSCYIHLKQSSANKGGHWPFTKAHNDSGRIRPGKVLGELRNQNVKHMELLLELSFREREPADSTVVEVLRESVEYWREAVPG